MRLNEMKEKKGPLEIIFILVVFCLYFYLAFNTPLTHDDWTWGTSDGWARLKNWFDNYNGRYMGNLTELFLTRVHWIRILLMAMLATMLIAFAAKQSKNSTHFSYLLSLLLFLSVPISMFSQTFSWVAGFSNYITSIVFVLLYLLIVRNVFDNEAPKYNILMSILVFPLGLLTVLFVEHVTIYVVLMAIFFVLYSAIKFKKVYLLHVSYLISSVIGAVIMFSNGAYAKILSGNDGYRSIDAAGQNSSLLGKIFNVYTEQMYPMLFLDNIILNIILSVFCIMLILKSKSQKLFNGFIKGCLLCVFIIYPLYKPLVINTFGISIFKVYTNEFEALFSVLFYLAILITVLLFTAGRGFKTKVIFYLISVAVLAGPLIFVHPFGPRCFLATYAFFVMVAIELGNYLIKYGNFNLNLLNKVLIISSVFIAFCFIYVFTVNGIVNRERIAYIHKHVLSNDKEIVLTKLPYEQYLWHSTPIIPGYQYTTFKEYYGIPSKTQLKIIPYSKWNSYK